MVNGSGSETRPVAALGAPAGALASTAAAASLLGPPVPNNAIILSSLPVIILQQSPVSILAAACAPAAAASPVSTCEGLDVVGSSVGVVDGLSASSEGPSAQGGPPPSAPGGVAVGSAVGSIVTGGSVGIPRIFPNSTTASRKASAAAENSDEALFKTSCIAAC